VRGSEKGGGGRESSAFGKGNKNLASSNLLIDGGHIRLKRILLLLFIVSMTGLGGGTLDDLTHYRETGPLVIQKKKKKKKKKFWKV